MSIYIPYVSKCGRVLPALLILTSMWASDALAATPPVSAPQGEVAFITFNVTKVYTDGKQTEVGVGVSCYYGNGGGSKGTTTSGLAATLNWELPVDSCDVTETVPDGYTASYSAGCSVGAVTAEDSSDCTITNTPAVIFSVNKTYSDGNTVAVDVTLDCPGATIELPAKRSVVPGVATEWVVSDLQEDQTCTATESGVPAGYTSNNNDCADVSLALGNPASCTIDNQQDPVEVTITKTYTQAHPPGGTDPEVSITLVCKGAKVNGNTDGTGEMTSGHSVTFTVSKFPYGGVNCVASEYWPAGYVLNDDTGCDSLSVTLGGQAPTCTIENRPTSATFTVDKNFSDGNPNLMVDVTPLCIDQGGGPGITYSPTHGNARQDTDFVTTVKYFDGATNCTASENGPVGYALVPGSSTCDEGVAVTDGASPNPCTLFNQQQSVDIYASKIFTGGGDAATFAIDNCGGGNTQVQVVSNSASPGSPAHYIVSNFPWDGASCNVTEPVSPDGYYETASTCNNLLIMPSDDDRLCDITNAPNRATFAVTKNFTDDDGTGPYNPTDVDVTISCYTGLPLIQSQIINQKQGVMFVVESFNNDELDCSISEDLTVPELAGYTPAYTFDGTPGGIEVPDACHFENVPGGAEYTCTIENDPDPVPLNIEKLWQLVGTGGDAVDQNFELTLYCDAYIIGGKEKCEGHGGSYGSGPGSPEAPDSYSPQYESCMKFDGNGSDTFTARVVPQWPSSHCRVEETVYDDSVEIDNSCDDLTVSHGQGDSCLITNTVFFEGIPTLSDHGKLLMALLVMTAGLMAYRRFV